MIISDLEISLIFKGMFLLESPSINLLNILIEMF